jgi:hypothetical protein
VSSNFRNVLSYDRSNDQLNAGPEMLRSVSRSITAPEARTIGFVLAVGPVAPCLGAPGPLLQHFPAHGGEILHDVNGSTSCAKHGQVANKSTTAVNPGIQFRATIPISPNRKVVKKRSVQTSHIICSFVHYINTYFRPPRFHPSSYSSFTTVATGSASMRSARESSMN